MTAPTPRVRRGRAFRKSCPTSATAFEIDDLQRIAEWSKAPRDVPLRTWLALDGHRTDETLCVNLLVADRIARWTVTPIRDGRARFAEASPRRRSWSLNTVADALEAVDAAVAFSTEAV